MLTDAVAVVKNIDALAAAALKAGRALRPSYLLGMCVYIALLLALLLDLRTHLYLRVRRPEGRPSVLAFCFFGAAMQDDSWPRHTDAAVARFTCLTQISSALLTFACVFFWAQRCTTLRGHATLTRQCQPTRCQVKLVVKLVVNKESRSKASSTHQCQPTRCQVAPKFTCFTCTKSANTGANAPGRRRVAAREPPPPSLLVQKHKY